MIRLREITKSFGTLDVLRGVSLEIAPGKITSIVGASGAGKSTLLQILGTLMRPDSGAVLYGRQDVFAQNDRQISAFRNSHIGFVFQMHRLLPEFTLEENVAMPALIAGEKPSEARKKACEWLDVMGLADRRRHRPAQLSGGECQRAAVARALINNPDVILADEPSGSLDSKNREALHSLFFDLRDKFGKTFVIVTHDLVLANNSDCLITLADGKIIPNNINLSNSKQ